MKSRAVKRQQAAERQVLRDKRTPQEQWSELNRRLGFSLNPGAMNAGRERDRLIMSGAKL